MTLNQAFRSAMTDVLDILLHQSGHIMLSDFDLSKQSGEPGGAPATIKQGGPNGVSRARYVVWRPSDPA